MSFQIIRAGSEVWEIFCLNEIWNETHEYEVVARVIRDGDLYWIEYPEWQERGKIWKRETDRGYKIPKGAFRAITDKISKPPPEKIQS